MFHPFQKKFPFDENTCCSEARHFWVIFYKTCSFQLLFFISSKFALFTRKTTLFLSVPKTFFCQKTEKWAKITSGPVKYSKRAIQRFSLTEF